MELKTLSDIKIIVDQAHDAMDDLVDNMDTACKKGCGTCCHQIVDIHMWEEPKMVAGLAQLDKKLKIAIGKNLRVWFKFFNKNTPFASSTNPLDYMLFLKIRRLFIEKKVPCPFLIDSSCSIYDIRPLVCRAHYSEASVDECISNPYRSTPEVARGVCIETLNTFSTPERPTYMKPLAYMVVNEFNINVQTKPIAARTVESSFVI